MRLSTLPSRGTRRLRHYLRNLGCNGCVSASINFAASLVSLFFGEGDWKETVKIAVLAGWDSDNPAATWGGLLGFMEGQAGIERISAVNFPDVTIFIALVLVFLCQWGR